MQIEPMISSSFTSSFIREAPLPGMQDTNPSDPLQKPSLSGQSDPVPQASYLTTLQSQFDSIMKELSKELAALEKRFLAAINQLAQGYESGAGVSGQPPVKQRGRVLQRYASLIQGAAQRNEIDPALLDSVIRQESGFNPHARSSAGAMGLMQLMPDTARSLGVRDPFDPAENVEGGARLLRQLLDRYNGRLDMALAAYNAGSQAVDKYGGVPPYAETQQYVRSIMSTYREGALAATPA